MENAVLVYQAGIANVFEVGCFNLSDFGREAKRLIQSDFRTRESFAIGLKAAGVTVISLYCNQAGDITFSQWKEVLPDAPFSDKFRPVFSTHFAINSEVADYYNLDVNEFGSLRK